MKTFLQFLAEGAVEHEQFNDHTKNPYHKILTQYGFHHVSTRHEKNPFAPNDTNHNDTMHRYEHVSHPGSSVTIQQHHSKDSLSKQNSFIHRYKQPNGITAPSSGDTKPQLAKNLERHYGTTK